MKDWDKVFDDLLDDILDEYNKNNISKKEMINIIKWVDKIKEIKDKNPNSILLFVGE